MDDKIVQCDACKYLLFEVNAQKRKRNDETVYFCKKHAVKWSFCAVVPVSTMGGDLTGEIHTGYYLNNVECDEKGNPIK